MNDFEESVQLVNAFVIAGQTDGKIEAKSYAASVGIGIGIGGFGGGGFGGGGLGGGRPGGGPIGQPPSSGGNIRR
jgi:hypothetical protein